MMLEVEILLKCEAVRRLSARLLPAYGVVHEGPHGVVRSRVG